jgi:hypothetical protein
VGRPGLDSTGPLFDQGQALANPVAAMPSLHAAFSLFLAVFFFPRVPRRWRPLLFAYPLAMMFTVLYCAEHYLVDVVAGWGYVLATFALVGVAERWWQHNIDATDRARHRHHTRRIPGNEGVTEIVEIPNRGHALTIDNGWCEVATQLSHSSNDSSSKPVVEVTLLGTPVGRR